MKGDLGGFFLLMNGDLRRIWVFTNGDLRRILVFTNGDLRRASNFIAFPAGGEAFLFMMFFQNIFY